MGQDPWQVPDHKDRNHEHYRRVEQPKILRLVLFLLGLGLLVFGLSLVFPTTSMNDPYLVRSLVILGIFGGIAAFWSRTSILKLIKYAGIWLLFIVGTSLFYLYQSDMGTRFMAALDPSGVTSSEHGLLVHRASDGHFWLRARINDVPVKFMVDTGASNVVLSPEDAAQVGINMGDLSFTGRAETANGSVMFAKTRVNSLEIGSEAFYDVTVTVNGADMRGSLLGLNILNRFSSVEMRGDTLILRP